MLESQTPKREVLVIPPALCRRVYSFRLSVRPFVRLYVRLFVRSFVIPSRL